MANEYQGNSIVDYLKSIGQDSSYQARASLASQHGITNYTGSEEQNLQLLNALKTSTSPTTPPTTTASPITTQAQQDLENVLAEIQKRQEAGTFTPTESQTAVIRQAQEAIPKSVTNVSQLGTTPTLPPDATITTYPQVNVLEATSVSDYIQKQQEKLEAERATAQAALSKAGLTGTGTSLQEQLFTGYQESAPIADYEKALTTAEDKYGVTESLAEVKLQSEKVAQLKGEIEKLEIQRQNELDVANKRLASMTSIQAEKNAINERYDSQRVKLVGDYNIEAAILAAKSNYLSEASKFVQNAVQAYTASITAEINRFDNLYSLASDWVNSLNAQEKSILDDAKAELIRERDLEEKRLNNVLNLKLNYPDAGIEYTDTLEEATAKAEKIAASDAEVERKIRQAQLSQLESEAFGQIKLTDTQIVTGSQKANMSIDEFKNLSVDEQAWFLTGRYENQLESIGKTALLNGLGEALIAINNDTTMPEVVKNSIRKDIIPYVDNAIANQTEKITIGKDDQIIKVYNSLSGAESTLLGSEKEKEEKEKMSKAAKALGYGVWYVGGGAERERLVANIDKWIDTQRNNKVAESAIKVKLRQYLNDAINNTVTADNPLIKSLWQ